MPSKRTILIINGYIYIDDRPSYS